MASTRTKTISYRRAVWFVDEKGDDLETHVRNAHAKLPTVAQRKFRRSDGQFLKGLRLKKNKKGGYFLHIVAETPGDHASTLAQKDESKGASDVSTAPPPAGMEFMDGDVLVFVNGDNVCICTTVLRDVAVGTFFRELFRKAKLGDESTKFELQKIANVDKVKMIKTQGVKEIDIRASLFDATLDYVNRKDGAGALGVVGKHLSAIFGANGEPKKDNLSVSVVLTADRRRVVGKALGKSRMEALAEEIAQGDDDYSIITGTGQRISADEVFVRQRVVIDSYGKSVDRDKAWAELERFYEQLKASGVTVQ